MIAQIFQKFFYQPIFNILIFFVQVIPGHDFGIAIILLTLLIRIILHPLVTISLKSQKKIAEIQPKLKEIQQKYSEDKERQAKETLKLFQGEKINPFGPFFFTLIQLPILIALFLVLKNFGNGLSEEKMGLIYPFLPKPINFSTSFLGIFDLSKPFRVISGGKVFYYWPALPLVILAILITFFQTQMLQPKMKKEPKEFFQKTMTYFFISLSFLILIQIPSAIALYWTVTSLYSLIQQRMVFKT